MRPNVFVCLVLAASVLPSCAGRSETSGAPPVLLPGAGNGGKPPVSGIPARYTVTDLGTSFHGSGGLTPSAVNDSGEVVGNAADLLPWVFKNGSLQALPLSATFTHASANDVNSSGVIAGSMWQEVSPYTQRAVLWKPDGTIVNLGTGIPFAGLPPVTAEALSISETGIIAGYGGDAAYGEFQPLIFDGRGGADNPCGECNGYTVSGRFKAVNDSGVAVGTGYLGVYTCPPFALVATPSSSTSVQGNDINDGGDVVGSYFLPDHVAHAFLNHNGIASDLGTLFPANPSADSTALAMNGPGTIVGSSDQGRIVGGVLNPHGFVYADGKMVDLNTLLPPECANWTVVEATSISTDGKIGAVVFVGGYPKGTQHAVLLTPAI